MPRRTDTLTSLRHEQFSDGEGLDVTVYDRDGVPLDPPLLDAAHDVVGIGVNPTSGAAPYLSRNAATFTTQTIKGSGGTLYAFEVANASAAAAYVSVFDKANPVPGTDVPALYLIVPAGTSLSLPVGTPGALFLAAMTVFSATADNGSTGSAAGVTVSARTS